MVSATSASASRHCLPHSCTCQAASSKRLRRITRAASWKKRARCPGSVSRQAGKAALTQEVVAVAPAEARKAGEVIEDKGEGAKRVADFLKELKVI